MKRSRWPSIGALARKSWLAIPLALMLIFGLAPAASANSEAPTPLWYSIESQCNARLNGQHAPCGQAANVSSCGFNSGADIEVNSLGGSLDSKGWWGNGWVGYSNRVGPGGPGQGQGFQCTWNNATFLEDAVQGNGFEVVHDWYDGNGNFHSASLGQPDGLRIGSVGLTWYDATHLEVFAVDSSNNIYWDVYTQNVGWGGWSSIYSFLGLTSAISVSSASWGPGDIELMAIGTSNHAVCHAWMRNYTWNGFWECPVQNGYGLTVYADAGTNAGNGRGSGGLDVVVSGGSGGNVYHICAINATWCSSWDNLGLSGAPDASADWVQANGAPQFDVYGVNATNGLFHKHWQNGWSLWCYGGDMGGGTNC